MSKGGWAYIITNYKRTVLYTGITSDIEQRILEHKAGVGSQFTTKYNCKYLLYFEEFQTIEDAIQREKEIKHWKRDWKLQLIERNNPNLLDLAKDWFTEEQIEGMKVEYTQK